MGVITTKNFNFFSDESILIFIFTTCGGIYAQNGKLQLLDGFFSLTFKKKSSVLSLKKGMHFEAAKPPTLKSFFLNFSARLSVLMM